MTLGNFHNLAKPYQAGRRGFDEQVFEFLSEKIGGLKGKRVLDVGCGTGIATRQLQTLGSDVSGADLAEGMIKEAKDNNDSIEYVTAPTNKLPFEKETFDLVTAFSAFHWFCDEVSVQEIKRVLKNEGAFAAINKNDVSGIRLDVNRFFEKYNVTHVKNDYDPEAILKQSGFKGVTKFTIENTENFSLDEAIVYLQSIALWNMVPEEEKPKLLQEIRDSCEDTLKSGKSLERRLETVVVIGFK